MRRRLRTMSHPPKVCGRTTEHSADIAAPEIAHGDRLAAAIAEEHTKVRIVMQPSGLQDIDIGVDHHDQLTMRRSPHRYEEHGVQGRRRTAANGGSGAAHAPDNAHLWTGDDVHEARCSAAYMCGHRPCYSPSSTGLWLCRPTRRRCPPHSRYNPNVGTIGGLRAPVPLPRSGRRSGAARPARPAEPTAPRNLVIVSRLRDPAARSDDRVRGGPVVATGRGMSVAGLGVDIAFRVRASVLVCGSVSCERSWSEPSTSGQTAASAGRRCRKRLHQRLGWDIPTMGGRQKRLQSRKQRPSWVGQEGS
jgi:hypothetical protein